MKEINKEMCPNCNIEGMDVDKSTVRSLLKDEFKNSVEGNNYRICIDSDCDVVYYDQKTGEKYIKDQISVPIWFKKDASPKYACYCSKVTELEVIDAVLFHEAKTVADVNKITGAMKDADCKNNNPLGSCCHHIIQDIIDRYLNENKEL